MVHSDHGNKPVTIYLDENMDNSDWTKTTWDIGTPEQAIQTIFGPARTHEEQQEALDLFMARPAAGAMPEEVRSALIALGFTVRERYII